MKSKISYQQVSKGLSRLLRKKNSTHFNQKDLSFDTDSRKKYFKLFENIQKNIQSLDGQFRALEY